MLAHATPITPTQPTRGGKLRILSPASEWLLNSSYANDSRIRKRLGRQSILLNSSDAESFGIHRRDNWSA